MHAMILALRKQSKKSNLPIPPLEKGDKGGFDRGFSGEDIQSRISETISLLYSLGRAPTDIGISGTRGSNNKTSS